MVEQVLTSLIEAEDSSVLVGLVLGSFWITTIMLGDEVLARLAGGVGSSTGTAKMNTMPELAPTSLVRPLSSFLFAGWLLYFIVRSLMHTFGTLPVVIFIVAWFLAACVVSTVWLGFGWYPPFTGLQINVREPKQNFGRLDYSMSPANLGECVFWQMFFYQLSAVVYSMELAIHQIMPHDQDPADKHGDNTPASEGMMAQELIHGKIQLAYSRQAEKTLNYPPGYRRFWRWWCLSFMPHGMAKAFFCWVESAFKPLTYVFAKWPGLFDRIIAEPKWVIAWHLLEESEHCWESVRDLMLETTIAWRLLMWSLGGLLLFVLMALSLIEGFAYGWRTLLFSGPRTFASSIIGVMVCMPTLVMVIQACTLLQLIFDLRPSDEAYHYCKDQFMYVIYKPYAHMFKATQSQKPGEHLKAHRSSLSPEGSISSTS